MVASIQAPQSTDIDVPDIDVPDGWFYARDRYLDQFGRTIVKMPPLTDAHTEQIWKGLKIISEQLTDSFNNLRDQNDIFLMYDLMLKINNKIDQVLKHLSLEIKDEI